MNSAAVLIGFLMILMKPIVGQDWIHLELVETELVQSGSGSIARIGLVSEEVRGVVLPWLDESVTETSRMTVALFS